MTAEQRAKNSSPAVQTPTTPRRRRRRGTRIILLIVVVLLAYVAFDLLAPRASRMRSFDPDEVARLETAMWRSYYARQRLQLYNQLSELLRTQYNLPFIRSNAVAYQAARAAFVFKDGHSRQDYEKALPYLISFYSSIRKVSDIPFDVERAARLEVEWWIIHRERASHAPGDLARALAELSSELYQMPAERFAEHARLRAEAMTIRDTKADAGGVTEQDWAEIDELLHRSWKSLKDAVNSPGVQSSSFSLRSEFNL
ncbi:MAG TPA: hypothetical protein VKF81_07625 [Blastocatellia bacterium]|nr:hypothetical protein [Blastocatellia bacterium]